MHCYHPAYCICSIEKFRVYFKKIPFYFKYSDSGIRDFGSWITQHTWEELYKITNPSEMCNMFLEILQQRINHLLPLKEITFHVNDKPWINSEVKTLIDKRQQAFKNNKEIWKHYRYKVKKAISSAKDSFYNKRIHKLKIDNPADWYRHIKVMTKGQQDQPQIIIPDLSDQQCNNFKTVANSINDKFLSVATDLPILDLSSLPAYLPSPTECPLIRPFEIVDMLCKLKLRKSTVSNDLPVRVLREFAYEISVPLCHIINFAFRQGVFPQIWKFAEIIPIPKVYPPTVSELRPIALTSYFAKIAESFIVKWLLEDISDKIDINQYGNRPGISTCHYLIAMLHYLYKNVDLPKTILTMLLTDFSKAFDRIDHNILIRKLIWLNVRPCIISLIIDFLHHRQQVVKYKGCISDIKNNNAGVPQGTKLGPVLFLIMINDACSDCPFPFYKYVDDLTILESRHYNQQSQMQLQINSFNSWSLSNNMKLNPKKCSVMTISFMKQPIEQTFHIDATTLNTASVVKVLGIYIQQNLKWDTQVKEMLKNCNRRLFMLRTLKHFNLPLSDLVTIYTGFVRPILEYCAPVFHSNLTKKQTIDIERIQKRACKIILSFNYSTYDNALATCNITSLEERREKLCLDFALNLEKHPVFSSWLPVQRKVGLNLRNPQKYSQLLCKTERFKGSAIPYFVKTLNNYYLGIKDTV